MIYLVLAFIIQNAWAEGENAKPNIYETVVKSESFRSASKVILDQESIRKSRATNINALLQSQANIAVAGTNVSPGQVYLRGGDSSNVLVLVDGLPFYDASTIAKNTNLNQIDLKSIRRIEIIKGSQSVLYGGQALSGVIKIETFPKEISSESRVSLEGGQRQYQKLAAGVLSAVNDDNAIFAQAQHSGKNNASQVLGSNQAYPTKSTGGSIAYLYSNYFDLFTKLNHNFERNDIPTTDAAQNAADDIDFHSDNAISGMSMGLRLKNSFAKPNLVMGYQHFIRKFLQASSTTNQHYGSDVMTARLELTPISTEFIHWLVGYSHTNEAFVFRDAGVESGNAHMQHQGIFTKASYSFTTDTEVEAGLRSEVASNRDRVDTYQMGFTFLSDFKIEHSTGFRVPSLFQRYSTIYGGNPNLRTEKAKSWSMSFEHIFENRNAISASLFQTNFDDLITYVGAPPTGGYVNVARTETKGVELGCSYFLNETLRSDLSLGYQEPKDIANAKWLARRPLRTGSARLTKDFEDKNISLEYVMSGARFDRNVMLSGYSIWNLSYNQNFKNDVSVYVRANNFMNSKYETALGYYEEGSFWLAGIEFVGL
jgi:iron complex outermembrane recepter protein